MQGRSNARKGTSMDRRTLLLGLLGGLAAAPMIVAATSSVEATPLPEAVAPAYQPLPEPASTVTEADPNAVRAEGPIGANTGVVVAVVSTGATIAAAFV